MISFLSSEDFIKIKIEKKARSMSKWSGSDFVGPTENNWPQGVGKFRFPNDVVYEGNFDKGEFHGDGTLHYPNGVSTIPTVQSFAE